MNSIGYNPDIIEKGDFLHKKFGERSNACDELMYILKQRADLEEYYSRNLDKMAEQLSKLVSGKDQIKDITSSLQSFFTIQAEQSRMFATNIQTEVIKEFTDFIKKQDLEEKNIQNIGKKHQQTLKINMEKFDSLRDSYMQISNQLKIQSQQSQNSQISEESYQQKIKTEDQFKKFIVYYNNYIENYFVDYAKITENYQNLEKNRREQLKDTVMKFLVYVISQIRNLQYDVDNISARIQKIDSEKNMDHLLFGNKQQSQQTQEKPLLTKVNFENYKYYMDFTLNKDGQQQKQQQQQQQQIIKKKSGEFSQQQQNQMLEQTKKEQPLVNQQMQQQEKQEKNFINSMLQGFLWSADKQTQQKQNQLQDQQKQQKQNQNQANQNIKKKPPLTSKEERELQKQQIQAKSRQKQQQQQQIQQLQSQQQQQISDKNQNQGQGQSQRGGGLGGEQFLENILVKTWMGKEINKFEIDTFKSFLKTGSDRQNFVRFYDDFFLAQKQKLVQIQIQQQFGQIQQQKQLQNQQKNENLTIQQQQDELDKEFLKFQDDQISQIQWEKVEIQLNPSGYTQNMKILYTLLEMCTKNYDISPILSIYHSTASIFKLILLPDEEKTTYEKIYLQQGLQGHPLFGNIKYWEGYLKIMCQNSFQNAQKQEKNNFFAENNNSNKQEQQYGELLESLNILVALRIPKESIIQSLKPLYQIFQMDEQYLINHIEKTMEYYQQQFQSQVETEEDHQKQEQQTISQNIQVKQEDTINLKYNISIESKLSIEKQEIDEVQKQKHQIQAEIQLEQKQLTDNFEQNIKIQKDLNQSEGKQEVKELKQQEEILVNNEINNNNDGIGNNQCNEKKSGQLESKAQDQSLLQNTILKEQQEQNEEKEEHLQYFQKNDYSGSHGDYFQ